MSSIAINQEAPGVIRRSIDYFSDQWSHRSSAHKILMDKDPPRNSKDRWRNDPTCSCIKWMVGKTRFFSQNTANSFIIHILRTRAKCFCNSSEVSKAIAKTERLDIRKVPPITTLRSIESLQIGSDPKIVGPGCRTEKMWSLDESNGDWRSNFAIDWALACNDQHAEVNFFSRNAFHAQYENTT